MQPRGQLRSRHSKLKERPASQTRPECPRTRAVMLPDLRKAMVRLFELVQVQILEPPSTGPLTKFSSICRS
jgi:hypothetical protein